MKWRKKPVIIEAFQWTEKLNQTEYPEWFIKAIENKTIETLDSSVYIKTLEGSLKITSGDFVICGVKGELYPCKPDIFLATYEKVE